jgi:uncharacterized protein DUF3309
MRQAQNRTFLLCVDSSEADIFYLALTRKCRGIMHAPQFNFPISLRGLKFNPQKELLMLTILLIILILALLGALPTWPYSHAWGYYPSGGLGILLIIVIILMLL